MVFLNDDVRSVIMEFVAPHPFEKVISVFRHGEKYCNGFMLDYAQNNFDTLAPKMKIAVLRYLEMSYLHKGVFGLDDFWR